MAHAALKLIREGQTLFLDTGSTNVQLATKLPSDMAQQVLFAIEMRVVGRVTSGSEITSDAFRYYSVRFDARF